jgi:2-keto-4-pentenoate hydratase
MSIERGTIALLTRRREKLAQGAEPIGWKIGFNVPHIQEKLGLDGPVAGYLSSDTLIEGGATWSLKTDGEVVVESEVAVEIGEDGRSVAALMPALELVDPIDFDLDIEQILAGNIFHRAVAFGPRVETVEPGPGRILVNGDEQHALTAEFTAHGLDEMVQIVADRLADAGERLRPGERIITGVLAAPHAAQPGEIVRLELEALGGVELGFS